MSDTTQQNITTVERIEQLPDELVEIMLAGAKEELASINDNVRFIEKKAFALIAVILSVLGFSGEFIQEIYTKNIWYCFIIGIGVLVTLFFAVRSTYAKDYYGAFFDIHKTLKIDEKYLQDKMTCSKILLSWYANSVAHNTSLTNQKAQYFNRALFSLIVTIITSIALFADLAQKA